MLHKFLTTHRAELIMRCRQKVVKRFEPMVVPAAIDHGVPVLLQQMADALRCEQATLVREELVPEPTPANTAVGRSAALHGAELLRMGYSIDQVVHEYGDVCQAITDLAVEKQAIISADEFRTLNRCLDNAIADAVTSFNADGQVRTQEQAQSLYDRLDSFTAEHRRLVEIAIQSFAAIQTGNVGLHGATATLLRHALDELNSLAEITLPQLHLVTEAGTVTSR